MEQKILDGAEPFDLPGNETGILVCHGFTGARFIAARSAA
jgi:hypothetical protein